MNLTKKIVILGHFGVGKTSLIRRFTDNEFKSDYKATIGVQVRKKDVEINGNIVSLVIWDLEGTPCISETRRSYLLGSSGFIYVFDLSRPETYENILSDKAYLKENYGNIPVVIVGNKKDLVEMETMAVFFKSRYIDINTFTSAKTGNGVNEAFSDLSELILQYELH